MMTRALSDSRGGILKRLYRWSVVVSVFAVLASVLAVQSSVLAEESESSDESDSSEVYELGEPLDGFGSESSDC